MGRKEHIIVEELLESGKSEKALLDLAGTYTPIEFKHGYINTHPELSKENSLVSNSSSKSGGKHKRNKCCGIWMLTLSLFLFASGSYVMWGTDLFDYLIHQQLTLANGSLRLESWQSPPVQAKLRIYIFNYTNIYEFETGLDKKLKVEEMGPYTYIETLERVNIVYNDNGTITYQDQKTYIFSEEDSVGSDLDEVVVPNMPFLGAVSMLKDLDFISRLGLSALLNGFKSRPFIRLPVGEFLWGYDDQLSNMASKFIGLQHTIPFTKFGILAGKNGTQPDVITIHTGEKDLTKTGIISKYNGIGALNYWNSQKCNSIEGTDGSIYPPSLVRPNSTVYIYVKDMCRRIPLVYADKYRDQHNVKVLRFKVPKNIFTSGETERKNLCYCRNANDGRTCFPSGVFNVSACAYGAPVVTSLPHFLYGDPLLFQDIKGLKPKEKDHLPYAELDPTMAVPMGGKSRFQLNIILHKYSSILSLSDAYRNELILPVSWMDYGVDRLSDDVASMVRNMIFLAHGSQIVLSYLSVIGMVTFLLLIIKNSVRKVEKRFHKRNLKASFMQVPLVGSQTKT